MTPPLSFRLVDPLPCVAELPVMPGIDSVLRVLLSGGGKLYRRELLGEWRISDHLVINERFVAALTDSGFLEPVWEPA